MTQSDLDRIAKHIEAETADWNSPQAKIAARHIALRIVKEMPLSEELPSGTTPRAYDRMKEILGATS